MGVSFSNLCFVLGCSIPWLEGGFEKRGKASVLINMGKLVLMSIDGGFLCWQLRINSLALDVFKKLSLLRKAKSKTEFRPTSYSVVHFVLFYFNKS